MAYVFVKLKRKAKCIFVYFLFAMPFVLSCASKHANSQSFPIPDFPPNEEEVANPGEFPFFFQKQNTHVVLPKHLGGKRAKGIAVLEVYINEKGEIKLVNIVKLVVRRKQYISIDYFEKEPATMRRKTYPAIVRPYVPFLNQYMRQQALVKSSKADAQSLNKIKVLVLFGKPPKMK